MYIPALFKMQDTDEMVQFIRQNSFGIMFSQVGGHPFATHVPMLIRQVNPQTSILLGHVAKANPHWKELDGAEVLVVFPGPHAYISPSWYVEKQAVPTWNYVAVHVMGQCRIIRDKLELHQLLADTVHFFEPDSPLLNALDEDVYVKMENSIVGFEIAVTAMEGKAKLSQNKSAASIQGVIDGLQQSQDCEAGVLSRLMQRDGDAVGGNE